MSLHNHQHILALRHAPWRVLACVGFILALAGASLAPAGQSHDVPIIAAASDLNFALEEIAAKFREDTGRQVRLSFGSSGNYYRQIGQGAPFQLFLSADEAFVFKLADAGRTEDRGVLYAIGRLVLFAPHGSSLKVDAELAGLREALSQGRIQRFSIANPEHAPYGRAAEEALRQTGLWDAVKPRLVLGENVSQAAQFATGGSAEGGIFAYSLALAPAVAKRGTFVLLPDSLHTPLAQRMVLVKGAGPTAREFYRYVQQPAARAILKRYGFVVPDESAQAPRQ